MESLKIFFVIFLISRFSGKRNNVSYSEWILSGDILASIGTSEDSSQEFLQWCNEELQNFQETEFVLPSVMRVY